METQVKDIMTKNPVIIPAETSLKEAAQRMREVDCGVLPVGETNKLQGIITDRDIVIRAVAEGIDTSRATAGDHMTTEIFYCHEEDRLQDAADEMRQHGVSRLIVQDRNGRACGILTFGCILRKNDSMDEISKVVESAVGKKAA